MDLKHEHYLTATVVLYSTCKKMHGRLPVDSNDYLLIQNHEIFGLRILLWIQDHSTTHIGFNSDAKTI